MSDIAESTFTSSFHSKSHRVFTHSSLSFHHQPWSVPSCPVPSLDYNSPSIIPENSSRPSSQATLGKEADRLIADLHLSLHSSKNSSLVLPLLWSRAGHLLQLPFPSCTHLQGITRISLLNFLLPLHCPSPQNQQTWLGNPQTTLSMDTRKLTTELHLSLRPSKPNLLSHPSSAADLLLWSLLTL